MKKEDKEFLEYLKKERSELCRYINSLEWNAEQRTKIESFLIAYDQVVSVFKRRTKKRRAIDASELNTELNAYINLFAGKIPLEYYKPLKVGIAHFIMLKFKN